MTAEQPFRSILVDVDASAAAHPALDRAIELARSCGARLRIVDVVDVPSDVRRYLPGNMRKTLVSARRERLQQFAAVAAGVPVETEVLEGRPATALIREVLRGRHDLLVRSHARDVVTREPKAYGATDMQLFRQCPCPVWAIGPGIAGAPRRLLAAVHATADPADIALSRRVIELALLMTRLEQGSLTLLQAWWAFGEDVLRNHCPPEELTAYRAAAESTAQRDLAALVDSFGPRLQGCEVILRQGHPEEVIPRFVVEHGIEVVVMGTVARAGIAGWLIGNTAERVLQRLVCSVLAVKPLGFVSPVRIDSDAA